MRPCQVRETSASAAHEPDSRPAHRYNRPLCRNAGSPRDRVSSAPTAPVGHGRQTNLGQPPRSLPQPGHRRGRQQRQALHLAADRRQPERGPPRAGAALLRARPAGAAVSRLGDPALRPVLAAPGHHLPAHRQPLSAARAAARHPRGADHHGPAPPGADQFPARQQPGAGRRPDPRRRADAQPPGSERLPLRRHRLRAWRVRRARCTDRPVPHGQSPALPHRPVRRRDRDAAHLRPRDPALDRQGRLGAPAAGP